MIVFLSQVSYIVPRFTIHDLQVTIKCFLREKYVTPQIIKKCLMLSLSSNLGKDVKLDQLHTEHY